MGVVGPDGAPDSVHPHARGADKRFRRVRYSGVRFIPTHVGRMPRCARPFGVEGRFIPTHVGRIVPRKEGETIKLGSSPRTWGGCPAGTAQGLSRNGSSPRTWGGYFGNLAGNAFFLGSSPRTWGGWRCGVGGRRASPVHPHARGADCFFVQSGCNICTVHPHARGADELLSVGGG